MILSWSNAAWDEFIEWQQKDLKTFKRIIKLIKDIDRNGYSGIGKPEPLKGDFSGYWSRRIDSKNRLVYKIKDDTIFIAQCNTHYGDK